MGLESGFCQCPHIFSLRTHKMKLLSSILLIPLCVSLNTSETEILQKFSKFLHRRYEIDYENNRIKTEEQSRITKLRNNLVIDFVNRTSLPQSILAWNIEAQSSEMLRSCGDSTFGACTNFIPFDAVWDYGCFCQFGEDAGTGKGTPQNEIDELCRALTYCYRCVRIDSLEETELCDPSDVAYEIDVSKAYFG